MEISFIEVVNCYKLITEEHILNFCHQNKSNIY